MSKNKNNKQKKNGNAKFIVFTSIITILNLVVILCFGLAYGNWFGFQDWFVTTAITTGKHQYLAYILYDTDTIIEVRNRNTIVSDDSSNTDDIDTHSDTHKDTYENVYEQTVLDREYNAYSTYEENGEVIYKIVQLTMDSDGVEGYIAFIYDPTRISLALSYGYPNYGEQVYKYYSTHGALLAINGGGHSYGANNTIIPAGTLIVDGEVISSNSGTLINNGGVIGFNSDGVLMLTKSRGQAAVNEGVVNGVEFGPFLIVNGQAATVTGNGGYGVHPRCCIGQRQDGIVMFLVIDGRNADTSGADINQLIEIFQRYEAYNAANLDGGGSATIAEKGIVLNNPLGDGDTVTNRYVSDAFIVK